MNGAGNNKIRARIPIAILILAYVVVRIVVELTAGEYGGGWGYALVEMVSMFPLALFGIYLLVMYKKQSAAPYFVFALLSTCYWTNGSFVIFLLLRLFGGSRIDIYDICHLSSEIACILTYITIFLIVKGSKKSKITLIISSSAGILGSIFYVMYMVEKNIEYSDEYIPYNSSDYLTALLSILLYVALIIYAALNNPAVNVSGGSQPAYTSITELTPDKALVMLKDKLDLGIINEEEYKAKRAEIISKL